MALPVLALVQTDPGPDKSLNLERTFALIDEAAASGADWVCRPETFHCRGPNEVKLATAEPVPGPLTEALTAAAKRHGIWLHAGSFNERTAGATKTWNLSLLFDPEGRQVAAYRKIHLFDVVVDGQVKAMESVRNRPGGDVVVADAPLGPIGMTICYDLRFPELFRILALRGATVVVLPSAFTARTGPAHWEVLVRARAVEDQVFVVAPGQCGTSPGALAWHGHSLVVDPWGTVLADGGDRPGHVVADLDLDRLADVRARLPSLANRRPTTYRWPGP